MQAQGNRASEVRREVSGRKDIAVEYGKFVCVIR